MTRHVLVRPEAESDLASAHDWYDAKRAGLGDEFIDTVATAMRELPGGRWTYLLFIHVHRLADAPCRAHQPEPR